MHNKAAFYKGEESVPLMEALSCLTNSFFLLLPRSLKKTGQRNNPRFLCATSHSFMRHSFRYLHDKESWNCSPKVDSFRMFFPLFFSMDEINIDDVVNFYFNHKLKLTLVENMHYKILILH